MILNPFSASLALLITRIPLPPPPATALSITGYPICSPISKSSSTEDKVLLPGIIGKPASFAVFLALTLSPIKSMIFESGPIKVNPFSLQILLNFAFSARKPYPG